MKCENKSEIAYWNEGLNVVLAGLYWSLESTIKVTDGTVTVNGTQLDDDVDVELGDDSTTDISTGAGADKVSVKATSKKGSPKDQTIHINTGTEDDRIDVDVSTANQAGTVEIDAGDGEDHIHFTGELKKNGNSSAVLEPVQSEIPDEEEGIEQQSGEEETVTYEPKVNLENSNGKMLAFKILNSEIYTDALTNKKQIEVLKEALQGSEEELKEFAANELFVDYVCEDSGDLDVGNVTITGTGFLTSLILKCKDVLNVRNLFANGINLILKAQEIIFGGTVEAKSIIAEATSDDAIFNMNISGAENLGIQDEEVAVGSDISYVKATITVEEDATVKASDAIEFKASAEQKASLLPVGEGYNFMAIKVGDAIIDILGNIFSGGSFGAQSSVLVDASASNTSLAQWFIPLGIAIAVTESRVNVGSNASITAGSNLSLLANSSVTISNIATMGTLPISLALSVVVADTLVDVAGNLTSQTGNVDLHADGKVNLKTVAAEKASATTNVTANPNSSVVILPGQNTGNGSITTGTTGTTGGSKSGGFFAVSVALQDVAVIIREDA